MPLQPQILGHLLLGVGFQKLLQRFPRPSLKIPPEAFLQVPHKRFKPLCVILDPHLGVGSFTGDFVARHNKTYTLFLFTHSKLRHLWACLSPCLPCGATIISQPKWKISMWKWKIRRWNW